MKSNSKENRIREDKTRRLLWMVHVLCVFLLMIAAFMIFRYYSDSDQNGNFYAPMAAGMGMFRILGLVLALGQFSTFVGLVIVGRLEKSGIDLWYTEFVLLSIFGALLVMYWGFSEMRYGFLAESTLDVLSGEGLILLAYFPFVLSLLGLIRAFRAVEFLERSLLLQGVRGVADNFRNRNDRWKSGQRGLWILLYQLMVIALALGIAWMWPKNRIIALFLFVWLLLANVSFLVYSTRQKQQQTQVFDRVATLAAGDVGRKLDVENMQGEVRRIALTVNALDDSLEKAVRERTRDERMKTDLIANVSHDLRTPLTSIINYVDLIKRENIDNPRVQEYLNILTEKTDRLASLMEALMEASRVSSGNLKIDWERIDMVEMVRQAYGEFQEQMEGKGLIAQLQLVDPPALIMADGKILWRVLDNLFTNLLKYAMPNTQVAIYLQETAHNLVFTMKNVSENPICFTSEELVERFTRGDVSRSTPGSGLGLSIAKSMTEQLKGRFEVISDEEMFRVRLIFPKAEER